MSHRYPTRFQAKATQAKATQAKATQTTFHAKQPQATVTCVYQTRSQTKKIQEEQRRAAEAEAALAKTVEYSRELMNRIHAVTTLVEKLELLLLLYQHFYDEPILLAKNYVTFRAATWEKMNEQEVTLLAKLQTLPASLGQTSEFWHLRDLVIQLLDQMERVRAKYW